MNREAIRVQQPDGSCKVIFREKSRAQETKPGVKQEYKENPMKEKREKAYVNRYYNHISPEHIDIFGRDLLNSTLNFHLNNGEALRGRMISFAQYEVLVKVAGKKVILMKQAIAKVEVL
jgi:hypothetical protein